MVKEYDKVKTLVEKNGYPIGSVGVVDSTYSTGPACEVEIWDETEYPVDVVTYLFDELEIIDTSSK